MKQIYLVKEYMKGHILFGDFMKKIDRILRISLIVVFLCFISGCSVPKPLNHQVNISYDIYQITDGDSEFDKLIADNPIDLSYDKDFHKKDLTTSQAVAV